LGNNNNSNQYPPIEPNKNMLYFRLSWTHDKNCGFFFFWICTQQMSYYFLLVASEARGASRQRVFSWREPLSLYIRLMTFHEKKTWLKRKHVEHVRKHISNQILLGIHSKSPLVIVWYIKQTDIHLLFDLSWNKWPTTTTICHAEMIFLLIYFIDSCQWMQKNQWVF